MKTSRVTIHAIIISALLPCASFAEEAQTPPRGAGLLQSNPKKAGDGAHKASSKPDKQGNEESGRGSPAEAGAKSDKASGAGVYFANPPHTGSGHGHGMASLKEKGAKPALGAYSKKYQHHPGDKGGEKEKPASGESHAGVPGETLKEQESKLHRMANPQKSETELRPISRPPTPSSAVSMADSAARGQGLMPAPGRHSPNPAIIDGRTTSRIRGAAAMGGAAMAGPH